MSANSNLRGAIFESLVTHFAKTAGYSLCVRSVDDEQLYDRGGLPMVHGLGEGHNADVLLEPPMTLPMTPESRLLVECKGYANVVGLDVIRGAITIRNDLNAYKRLSDRHLAERRAGRRKRVVDSFPYYHVAVASLRGFTGPAQSLAATYHIELLDYQHLPILGDIPELVSGLAFPSAPPSVTSTVPSLSRAEAAVSSVRAALDDALESRRTAVLDAFIAQQGWQRSKIGADLHQICESAATVRASYSVTLPDGTSMLMLAASPIRIDPGSAAIFQFYISYVPSTASWRLAIGEVELQFQLPSEFFESWQASDFSPRAASVIKRERFGDVELFGPVLNARTDVVELRHLQGVLSQDSLRASAIRWEGTRSRTRKQTVFSEDD